MLLCKPFAENGRSLRESSTRVDHRLNLCLLQVVAELRHRQVEPDNYRIVQTNNKDTLKYDPGEGGHCCCWMFPSLLPFCSEL